MFPAQLQRTDTDELIRCGDSSQLTAVEQKGWDKNAKTDVALTYEVDHALWRDAAFRATDYNYIDARVFGGFVHLNGHVSSLTNRRQAEKAIQRSLIIVGLEDHLLKKQLPANDSLGG